MNTDRPTNPKEYSLAELYEALDSVDGVRYPERKAELEAELQSKRRSGEVAAAERKEREKRFQSLHMSNTRVLLYSFGAGILIIMGACLLGWVGYNYLVEMSPSAEGTNPLGAILWSIMFLLYGLIIIRRIRFSLALRAVNDD